MTSVYHVTSLFESTTTTSYDQFEARIVIIGSRLERYIHGRLWHLSDNDDDLDDAFQGALIRLWKAYRHEPWIMDLDDRWWLNAG